MKLLLLSAALLAASSASALNVTYDWSGVLSSASKTTSTDDAVPTEDGGWFAVFRTDNADGLQWNGSDLNLPEDQGTATASKLTISKIDGKGEIKWNITSTIGAFGTDFGKLSGTPDGGAVITFTVRKNSKDASIDPLATLVDAKNNIFNITIADYPDAWVYVPMVMKFSADGAIEWLRQIKCDYSAVNGAVPTQPTSIKALTTDPDGNIYISGFFNTPVSFPESGSTWAGTIIPVNTPADWKSGSDTSVGDMFITKLNPDGFYAKSYTVNSDAAYSTRTQATRLAFANGRLFWAGTTNGLLNGTTFQIGSSTVTPTIVSVKDAPKALETNIVGAMDTELTPAWTTTIPTQLNSSGTSASIMQKGLDAYDNNTVYLTGSVSGGLDLGSSVIASQKAMLEGCFVAFDATTGTPKGGNILGESISNYYGAFVNTTNGHVITYGSGTSAETFIIDYDAEYANPVKTALFDKGQTAFGCALNPANNQLLSLSRGKGATTAIGGATATLGSQFTALIGAFTLSDFKAASGIEAAEVADAGALKVYGTTGAAVFTAAGSQNVAVYSATGALVKSVAVAEGTTTVELPAGFYIAAGQKFIVR